MSTPLDCVVFPEAPGGTVELAGLLAAAHGVVAIPQAGVSVCVVAVELAGVLESCITEYATIRR